MDARMNRILGAGTPVLFDESWDFPKLHIRDASGTTSYSGYLIYETKLPKAYYFLLSLVADRNSINNISDTGFVRSCLFALLVQISSFPSGVYTPT